ncbi:MAG: hypothetical protein QMC67_10110 [Candidatus Wallbacteria bacterium]
MLKSTISSNVRSNLFSVINSADTRAGGLLFRAKTFEKASGPDPAVVFGTNLTITLSEFCLKSANESQIMDFPIPGVTPLRAPATLDDLRNVEPLSAE